MDLDDRTPTVRYGLGSGEQFVSSELSRKIQVGREEFATVRQ